MRDTGLPLVLVLLLGMTPTILAAGTQRSTGAPQQPAVPTGPTDLPSVRISGRIFAPSADQPPENLDVRIETSGGTLVAFAYTDGIGSFEFRDIDLNPDESHYIVVNAPGFAPVRERIDNQVDRRRGGNLSIQLRAERPAPDLEGAADALRVVDLSQLQASIPDEAQREYDRALEDIDEGRDEDAVERLERAVILAPDFFEAFDALGAAYLAVGRHRDAEVALNRALELGPGAARPVLNLGTLAYQIGEAHFREGRFDEALEAFGRAIGYLEESIRREPLAAQAFHHLGAALYRVGQYDSAEAALREAQRLDPTLHDARLVLINVYTRQRRFDDALTQLDAYISENPDSTSLPALERVRNQIESARQQ